MQTLKTKPTLRRGGVTYLPTASIEPCPMQARKNFDDDSLKELSESIRGYGILNPLTVRVRNGAYELIAGERRLRAAKLAGLREVPCIILEVSMEDAGLISMVENLQRRDLNYIEEAMGIHQLILMFGMSQEEAAKRIGKSQSAVANKLRLLKLPGDILDSLRENDLSERHGRALLRLSDSEKQRKALKYIMENDLTVAATDAYIDSLVKAESEEKINEKRNDPAKRTFILKDVRVFLNSLNHGLELMKQGGIDAGVERHETEDKLVLTISIPKRQ